MPVYPQKNKKRGPNIDGQTMIIFFRSLNKVESYA